MTILEILDSEIPTESQAQIKNVHRLECEEVLDNLGYVVLNRNDDNLELESGDFIAAIKEFRQEYGEAYKTFQDYDEFSNLEMVTLTEAEIEFMQKLSSLENEFDLHKHSLGDIASNKLLSRVLTYRLNILSVFEVKITNQLPDNIVTSLNQLKVWCNINDMAEIINLLGDVEKLSEAVSVSNNQSDSLSHYFAFFEAQEKRFKMPELPKGSNWEYFEQNFVFLDKKHTDKLIKSKKDKKKIEIHKDSPLNKLQLRLIQIRFWLLGTYEGELDSDIGPVTVEGIQDALLYAFEGSNSNADAHLLRNLVYYMGKDTWVVNVNLLFRHFFPNILDNENTKEKVPDTLSEKIVSIIGQLDKPEDKNAILSDINDRLKENSTEVTKRKVKTRGGKGFFKSIRKFFNKLVELVKMGIEKVKAFLAKLFTRVKNCLRILVREFKKIIDMIKTALAFFFSERTVNTKGLSTDYDFNFDSCTKLSGINKKLVDDHIQKINYITQSMKETSDFLGVVLSILIKVVKGPFGWVQIGLDVIKYLSRTNFSYNKLLFRSFS